MTAVPPTPVPPIPIQYSDQVGYHLSRKYLLLDLGKYFWATSKRRGPLTSRLRV